MKNNQFTPSGLVNFLNEKFIMKSNGSSFTMLDIQQYVKARKTPKKYGNYKIVRTRIENQKLTILTIYNE